MSRRGSRRASSARQAREGGGRERLAVAGSYPIDTGTVHLSQESGPPSHWLLTVNGVPSSTVCPHDPSWLGFEYLQVMAAVIASHPHPAPEPLAVLHLGGAGCALAWALERQRPGSRQLAVEIDATLVALVREWFDLPRAPRLRLRVGDAAAVVAERAPGSADVVVRDVFSADTTPDGVRGQQFTRDVARLLRPDGMYLANVAAPPDLGLLRDEIATVASVFAHVAVIAETSVLRGRRYGNAVVVAGTRALDAQVGRDVLRTGLALRVVHGQRLAQLAHGGRVLLSEPSPSASVSRDAAAPAGVHAGVHAGATGMSHAGSPRRPARGPARAPADGPTVSGMG